MSVTQRVIFYIQAKPQDGLVKWFGERWVDISRPDGKGGYAPCGRKSATTRRADYPKCLPLKKAQGLTDAQRRRLVHQKRARRQGVGGKPTHVRNNLRT